MMPAVDLRIVVQAGGERGLVGTVLLEERRCVCLAARTSK